jgi:hypothetical protein
MVKKDYVKKILKMWHSDKILVHLKKFGPRCMFNFYTFELHHGLKVCYACPCRTLDGYALSSPTLKSRHTS